MSDGHICHFSGFTLHSVNGRLEAAMQRLTNLCSVLNDMEPICVLNHVFVLREVSHAFLFFLFIFIFLWFFVSSHIAFCAFYDFLDTFFVSIFLNLFFLRIYASFLTLLISFQKGLLFYFKLL